jgi:hypothetical protein
MPSVGDTAENSAKSINGLLSGEPSTPQLLRRIFRSSKIPLQPSHFSTI